MVRRIDELRALRVPLASGDEIACAAARQIGQALRGSGSTFGFADLSAVAAIVETSSDEETLRRVEGLITELHILAREDESVPSIRVEWLVRAAGLQEDPSILDGVRTLAEAWEVVARAGGLSEAGLAERVADDLGIELSDIGARRAAALHLVPPALMIAGRVLPLKEDSETITVATAEPTSLPMELELQRVTGRRPVFVVATPTALSAILTEVLEEPIPDAPVVETPVRPTLDERDTRDRAILVVDDEQSTRLLVRHLLEKREYRVVEAEDGVEALEILASGQPIELVVADLNMPRMDGLELMWELREIRGGEHLPVIVVTGEVDEILETQLMEEGADDYIRKPVDARLFLARVEATIRRAEG
jgi:CheY-like chemotaxis protein